MPLVQAGELLRDLEDAFLSYLRLSMCGVWRKSSWFRRQRWGAPQRAVPAAGGTVVGQRTQKMLHVRAKV